MPVKQTRELAQVSEEAVYDWFKLFRTHLPEQDVILEGIIQLDEAYGKGWMVLMGKQTGTRKVAQMVLHETSANREHALQFLQSYVKPGSQLNSRERKRFNGLTPIDMARLCAIGVRV